METKHLIGLVLIIFGSMAGGLLACFSRRARDVMFFLLILGRVVTERLDVNFWSLEWYRGTTRGIEFSFVDIFTFSLLIGLLLGKKFDRGPRWFWPGSLGLMLLYFCYACFSVATSEPHIFGLFELSKILRGIMVFLAAAWFVRGEREARVLVFGLACGVFMEGAWAVKDRYLDGIHRVTGSLDHPNSLSMYLCLTAPVLVAAATSNISPMFKRFCFAGITLAAVAVLLTISRAGVVFFGMVIAGATAACVSPKPTLKKGVIGLIVVCGMIGMVAKAWNTLQSRYSEATLEEEKEEGRGLYIKQAGDIAGENFFGVGLNNWSYWVSRTYGAKVGLSYKNYDDTDFTHFSTKNDDYNSMDYSPPAHSLGALTAGELGIPGLIIFSLVWLRQFQMAGSFLLKRNPFLMHRLGTGIFFGIVGIFLQSQTEWTYRQTPIFFTFHIMMGAMASLYYQKGLRRAMAARAVKQEQHYPVAQEAMAAGAI